MASWEDVRRVTADLPQTDHERGGFAFRVAGKPLAWVWLERQEPRQPRIPNEDVIAVRVANELEKQTLIDMDPAAFFTEPHYHGYPAVLVRLAAIDEGLLEDLLAKAWRIQAPRRLVREFDVPSRLWKRGGEATKSQPG